MELKNPIICFPGTTQDKIHMERINASDSLLSSSNFCDLASEKLQFCCGIPYTKVMLTYNNVTCFFTRVSKLPYCCLNVFLLRYKPL